jgi:hypothetical protein
VALIGASSVLAAPAIAAATPSASTVPAAVARSGQPDLGPNVYVFDPSMPQSQIQQTVDAIAARQLTNQFGTERYALLFKPGTLRNGRPAVELRSGLLHRCRRSR